MINPRSSFWLVWVLPALLLLAAGLGLGCYYETNDDAVITLLLQGRMAAAPVANLQLYFHLLAAGLAQLYQAWPGVPWYGLLLYALLYAATVLSFGVFETLLRPWLRPSKVGLVLTLFFLLCWVEHGLWFNYVRVPLLLAPAGLLFAAQRPGQRWAVGVGLLAFGLAWLIRPSAAVLGLVLAWPGAWWLSGRRSLGVLVSAALLAGSGSLLVGYAWSPAAARYRELDVLKSNLNDYQLLRPTPRTVPDSLGLHAAQLWLLSDSTLVNAALFRRAAPLDVRWFLLGQAPHKALLLVQLLARDYFPLLLLLGLSWLAAGRVPNRRGFAWVQAGYAAGLLALGIVLKLPPRLALPYLDAWVLANSVFLLRVTPPRWPVSWPKQLVTAGILLVVALYGYKTWHRRQRLSQEQARNQVRLHQLVPAPVSLVVADGLAQYYKSSSPFQPVQSKAAAILMLTGWQSADPSQAAFRRQLTGTADVSESLRRLAKRGAAVQWCLPPAVGQVLNHQLERTRSIDEPPSVFCPLALLSDSLATHPQLYAPCMIEKGRPLEAKIL